jgi:hypothetical protein
VICARPTCGKAMGEDEKFGYDMRLRGLPQRRYFCSDGHSLTTGVEEALAKKEVVPLEMRLRALTCQRCDAPLVRRRVDAKYCLPCVRLVDVERLRRERAERAAARAAEPPRCRNGHLVTPETTIVEKKGTKRCLICRTAAWRRSAEQPQRKSQQAAWRARVRARRTHCRAGHLLDAFAASAAQTEPQGAWPARATGSPTSTAGGDTPMASRTPTGGASGAWSASTSSRRSGWST